MEQVEEEEESSLSPATTPSEPRNFEDDGVLDEDVKSKDTGEEASVFNDESKAGNIPEEREGGGGGGGGGGGVKR